MEVNGQLGKSTCLSDEPGIPFEDRSASVPQDGARSSGLRAAPQGLVEGHFKNRFCCPLEGRSGRRVSFDRQLGETVKHKIQWMRTLTRWRQTAGSAADLIEDVFSAEVSRHERGRPSRDVGAAREVEIERLEPSGGP